MNIVEEARDFVTHSHQMKADTDAFILNLADEIEKLTAALMRIDGINDNPACFNPEIDEVLRTVGMS